MKRISGLKVKKIRERKDITKEELADAAGISGTYVAKIERGDSQPTVSIAYAIAKKLNVDLNEITEEIT